MEESIILWLQSTSTPFLDFFMKLISYMVSWVGVLILLLLIFLFASKRYAIYYGLGFLTTIGVNFVIKEIVARPRPYMENLEIVNKLNTIGKSFPSGHSASVMFLVLMIWQLFTFLFNRERFNLYGKKWFKVVYIILSIALVLLTITSRMYLGQHYLTDTICGLLVGIVGFIATYFASRKKLEKK